MNFIGKYILQYTLIALIFFSSTGIGWTVSTCQCFIQTMSCCIQSTKSCCQSKQPVSDHQPKSHPKCCFSFEYLTSDINFVQAQDVELVSHVDLKLWPAVVKDKSFSKSTPLETTFVLLNYYKPDPTLNLFDYRLSTPFLQRFQCEIMFS